MDDNFPRFATAFRAIRGLVICNFLFAVVAWNVPGFLLKNHPTPEQLRSLVFAYAVYRAVSLGVSFVVFLLFRRQFINDFRFYFSLGRRLHAKFERRRSAFLAMPPFKNRPAESGRWTSPASLAVLVFLLPIILDLAIAGWSRIFSYFAADAFYYLTVSRNFAHTGSFTFDRFFPTNGFHPLWQWIESVVFLIGLSLQIKESFILLFVFALNCLAVAGAILLLAGSFKKADGYVPAEFTVLPLGVYALLTFWIHPQYGSLWSMANGMETSLVLLTFSLVVYLFSQPAFLQNNRSAIAIGAALGLMSLARLDHALFAPLLLAFLLIGCLARKSTISAYRVILTGAVCSIIIGLYLLDNFLATGKLIPISGALKSSFPYPTFDNFATVITALTTDTALWRDMLFRFAQIVLPALAAVAYGFWYAFLLPSPRRNRLDRVLAVTALFVLALAGYNLFFVGLGAQGHWYFPVSILFVSLAFCQVMGRQFDLRHGHSMILRFVLVVVVAVFFVFIFRDPDYNSHYARFYLEEAPKVRAFYGENTPRIIEVDDGIIGFATGFPTMAGFGFALDQQAAACKQAGMLLPLAYSRGFDRIASYNYWNAQKAFAAGPAVATQIFRDRMTFVAGIDRAALEIEYRSPSGRFVVFRITDPGPGAPTANPPADCGRDR